MARVPGLAALARRHGVETRWRDDRGVPHAVAPETLLAVLAAAGAPVRRAADVAAALAASEAARWRTLAEPVAVAWDGRLPPLVLRLPSARSTTRLACELVLEDGTRRDFPVKLDELPERRGVTLGRERFVARALAVPETLPAGVHRLRLQLGRVASAEVVLLCAPRRAAECARGWGVFLPLYALREAHFGGLARLSSRTAARGGALVSTLPLLPTFLDEHCEPSPYQPVSRLAWNEVYVDARLAPEWEAAPGEDEPPATALVDWRDLWDHRRSELQRLAGALSDERAAQLDRFLEEREHVGAYALFRAASERRRTPWTEWPTGRRLRDLTDDADPAAVLTYAYAQWLAHEQLGRVGPARLGLDLPLGTSRVGFDVWRRPELFALAMSTGAPPDAFFRRGQDWGFPPAVPSSRRADGYAHARAVLRHHLEHAGLLRIDHVMGLERLFWIPAGAEARDGTYVHGRLEEELALVCLESARAGVPVQGEDLGTVSPAIRRALEEHGLLRSHVLQFSGPEDEVPAGSVASLNTHDTPTFAGWRAGTDVFELEELGFLGAAEAAEERHRRAGHVEAWGQLAGSAEAALVHLARSPARLVLVNLEDLWGETRAQNVPGTHHERPNWRGRAAHDVDDPRVVAALAAVDRARRAPPPASTSDLGDWDLHLFNEGSHLALGDKLGARAAEGGTAFRAWAPNALAVSVIGDWNGWDGTRQRLTPRGSSGLWEGFAPGVGPGALYKYRVWSGPGWHAQDRADPLALYAEVSPRTASVVWRLDHEWHDGEWLGARGRAQALDAPLSIYEVHLGSWQRQDGRFLSYREIAPRLAEHVEKLGFTHVELLPVMEHPFYGSWGYQGTGYFAPTSRFGSPQDFMALVDHLHQRGLGVILDWVPSHFPSDPHALWRFDGTHLYEHADPRQGIHPDWNSCVFNYGRKEVQSFLLSSAMHWLGHYHADALRVDAVASMLYLDYSRKPGEWVANPQGGRENLDAIAFLRRLNEEVYARFPGVQTIAEESTAWPMVSRPTAAGGLGFGLKWDMGWMHDMLDYMSQDPVHRRWHHDRLTFRMLYAWNENFVLALSHDEVVHGKQSLLERMPGDEWQKFANLRLLYGAMWGQPGKKLLFMGCEFAQRKEWDHESALDWHLLEHAGHRGVMDWVRDLNRAYREVPALHRKDCDSTGFRWVVADDAANSVAAWLRTDGEDDVLVVCNFTPVPRSGYCVGVPRGGTWREILNSDAKEYGGSGLGNGGAVRAQELPAHGLPCSLELTLPPLAAVFLRGHR